MVLVADEQAVSVGPDGSAYPIPSAAELHAGYEQLARQAADHRRHGRQVVVVQGLGFVGSAVAAVIAGAKDARGAPRHFVIGVDLASPAGYWKVEKLSSGVSPIKAPDPELDRLIHEAVYTDANLRATAAEEVYGLADVIVVDVPLSVLNPLADNPADLDIDLKGFCAAIRTIGRRMRPDALVLVETTVPVGTCERIAKPLLVEERARRGIDAPLYLAHAYERVMPGPHYADSIRHFWRVFSGVDAASAARALQFLESFIDTASFPVREVEEPASSELAKLLENSYRAANIAFIHEWTLLAQDLGINLFEVIEAIRVRRGTHDNMRFPGFGVGGYCLTKDSLLAQWGATHLFESKVLLEVTLHALRVNYYMPLHTFDLLDRLAEGRLEGRTVVVCGVSYLPEVADTRNSPTEVLVDRLAQAGARVVLHDPYVAIWAERPEVPVEQDLEVCLRQADAVIFAVPHRPYRELTAQALLASVAAPPLVVDAQNVIADGTAAELHAGGCRLLGVGKGHWRKRGYQ
jgi:nucleotide sugar dehydrogenase